MPQLEYPSIADFVEECLQLDDEASEMLAYEAVCALDTILEQI
jgi:hypothetical protein